VIGVEIGGAVKNVIAIAAGISDGLGLGANSRTALITRGLSEMVRLGSALDAKPTTFMGLTGLGDLMLTASDNQSRNRRFGLLLAKHHNVEQALIAIDQVVEGVRAAECVHQVATLLNVEMPICECVYQILKQRLPLNEAVDRLMNRSLKTES
jgi:glycerol-3-phosphate dehydrogenase (NAD(P)+)